MAITYNYTDVAAGQLIEHTQPNSLADDDLLIEETNHAGGGIVFEITSVFPDTTTTTITLDDPPGNFTWAGKTINYQCVFTTDNDAGAGSVPDFTYSNNYNLGVTQADDTSGGYKYVKSSSMDLNSVAKWFAGTLQLTTTPTDHRLINLTTNSPSINIYTSGANLMLDLTTTDNFSIAIYLYMRLLIFTHPTEITKP